MAGAYFRAMTGAFSMRFVLCTIWIFSVGAGIAMVLNYQTASGSSGITPEHWPAETQIPLDSKRDTLIMFAHPQCPCTRASVEELNRLLAKCDSRIAAHVLFSRPENSPADWTQTSLRQSVAAIPGVTVQDDFNNAIAQKFGAETSGFVLLFNPQGQMLFKGGITGSRGHAGDNAGEEAIITLVNGKTSTIKQTPVFGCSLFNKDCTTNNLLK